MRAYSFLFIVLMTCFYTFTDGIEYKIPPYVKRCSRKDPKMNECLKEAIGIIAPYLKDGIPSMRIPPLDPFVIDKIDLDVGTLQATFRNVKVYNGTNLKALEVKEDYPKGMGSSIMLFPNLHMEGDFNVHGKLLLLELNGASRGSVDLTNTTARLTWKNDFDVRDGKRYMKLLSGNLNVSIGSIHFDFGELFKNNPQLSDITNQAINDNLDDFIKELMPVVNKALQGATFGTIINILNTFPEDVLFP